MQVLGGSLHICIKAKGLHIISGGCPGSDPGSVAFNLDSLVFHHLSSFFKHPAYFERKVGPTSSSPEGYASLFMQHGELASLFANLQSLQLTAHSMTKAYDAQWQRLEQLTSLTGLSCLKIEGNWSWGNTDLYKVRPFNSRLACCAVEQWASTRPFTPTLRGGS